jgi:hypothetical protein
MHLLAALFSLFQVLDGGDKGGLVILESMPFQKFRTAILNPSTSQKGGKTENV